MVFFPSSVFSLDFFKYIPFRSFWFNKAVWNICIISAGRGNIKTLIATVQEDGDVNDVDWQSLQGRAGLYLQ